jgi:selenium metabolism protein YedF
MRIVDTKGQTCPAPLIATKRALKESEIGGTFKVLTDNETSLSNLIRFLKDNNTEFSVEEAGGVWILTITKSSGESKQTRSENYSSKEIPHFKQGSFIIAFSSDRMGEGDDELGHMLMGNFIKAITDLEVLPGKMVFYNKGVILGSEDSPVIGHLKEIEKMGVRLLLCATCVRYYSLEEKIKIGSLSNMFEITQIMASGSNIIKP